MFLFFINRNLQFRNCAPSDVLVVAIISYFVRQGNFRNFVFRIVDNWKLGLSFFTLANKIKIEMEYINKNERSLNGLLDIEL